MKKLGGVDQALANFLASGVLALGPKLGPLLWQLPPNLAYREDRMREFFASLPATAEQAAQIAARCDDRHEGAIRGGPGHRADRRRRPDPACGRGAARLLRAPATSRSCAASSGSPWSWRTPRAASPGWTR